MRIVISFITSALILAGFYFVAFGVPESLSGFWGGEAVGSTTTAAADQEKSRPGGGRSRPNGDNATVVVLTAPETQPYDDVLQAIGTAEAIRSADLVANVSGEVIETNLTANTHASEGDMLVQLDARVEALNLEIAEAELVQANDTAERYERLQESGNSTVTDVMLSETKTAQRLAEANVGLAQVALDDRTIRAPISGKLGLSTVEIGDVLSSDRIIVTIDDSEALVVVFELPERSVGLLVDKQDVLASTPSFAGRVFKGEIVSFDSRIDSVTRSVTVHARIENPDGLLWPGMTFAVRIIRESEPLLVVPSTAVTWSMNGSSIWIDKDGTAEQVAATILFRRGDQVWIDADIAPGTLVVVEGAQKLREGSRIKDADAPAKGVPDDEKSPIESLAVPEIGQVKLLQDDAAENPT